MSAFHKLKTRTEWQAFLLSFAVLWADHLLGLEVDPETLWQMIALSSAYGASRGLSKIRHGDHRAHPGQAAAEPPADAPPADEPDPDATTLVDAVIPPADEPPADEPPADEPPADATAPVDAVLPPPKKTADQGAGSETEDST